MSNPRTASTPRGKGLNIVERGDISRPARPSGNFHAPGVVSRLPKDGVLEPEIGVDLTCEVDQTGFAKATARMPGPGPTWISGLVALRGHDQKNIFYLIM